MPLFRKHITTLRKYLILLSILYLAACGAEVKEPSRHSGTAGQPVYLSIQADHLQANQSVEWHFTRLPDGVILTRYAFSPSPESPQVAFTPPDTGVYEITYTIENVSGTAVLKKPFILDITEQQPAVAADSAVNERLNQAQTTDDTDSRPARNTASEITTAEPSAANNSEESDIFPPKIPGRYTVQVAARKTFSAAETVAGHLKSRGYQAYIQRVQFPDTNEIWYRVRIGSFITVAEAKELQRQLAGMSLLKGQDIWIDFQRKNL